MTQLCGARARRKPPALVQGRLLFDEKAQPFGVFQRAAFRIGLEVSEALGHAIEAEFDEAVQCRVVRRRRGGGTWRRAAGGLSRSSGVSRSRVAGKHPNLGRPENPRIQTERRLPRQRFSSILTNLSAGGRIWVRWRLGPRAATRLEMALEGGRMNGDPAITNKDVELTTPHGLDAFPDSVIAPWEKFDYDYGLVPYERLYRETKNPLYVWKAIQRFGKLRKKTPQMGLPAWCLDYLCGSANRIDALYDIKPADAIDKLPQALSLKAGKGANYFARMASDEWVKKLAHEHSLYRAEMTAAAATLKLATQQASLASPEVRAGREQLGLSEISARSIERKVARGKRLTKLSTYE